MDQRALLQQRLQKIAEQITELTEEIPNSGPFGRDEIREKIDMLRREHGWTQRELENLP